MLFGVGKPSSAAATTGSHHSSAQVCPHEAGGVTYCFFGFGPAMFLGLLAPIVFSALAPPCFFGFLPLLYLGAGEGQNPIVFSASLYNLAPGASLREGGGPARMPCEKLTTNAHT